MPYQFSVTTLENLRIAFADLVIVREKSHTNPYRSWNYLFLKFKHPVTINLEQNNDKADLVDIIFSGNAQLTKKFIQHFGEGTQLEMGLRWIGSSRQEKIIWATGFALQLSYPGNCQSPFNQPALKDLLCKADFLKPTDMCLSPHLEYKEQAPFGETKRSNSSYFFKQKLSPMSSVEHVKRYLLKHIKPIKPRYLRDNEKSINPAYQTVDTIHCPLKLNEKKIWLLRSDGTISLGNKNAYWISFGENDLATSIDENLHQYINWDDRAGHPSLAIPENSYDGSALYGGYLCQKANYLQIFTSSGRYYREDLSLEEKKLLEAYIAFHFQKSFGAQAIIFYEGPYKDYYELSLFYANHSFQPDIIKRVYTDAIIKEILDSVPVKYEFFDDKFYNYAEALREGEDSNIARYWKMST